MRGFTVFLGCAHMRVFLVAALLLAMGCSSKDEELRYKFEKFKKAKDERSLGVFLQTKADGHYLYLKNALILRAMVEDSQLFERVLSKEESSKKYYFLREVMENRKHYIQYYPDYFPPGFEEEFRKHYGRYLEIKNEVK